MKLLLTSILLVLSVHDLAAEEIDFTKDVQPILAGHCYECHGADEKTREGGLRLDVHAAALAGGDGYGPAIVPHKPEESALIARIAAEDADELMPPPEKKNPLTKAQIAILKQWVSAGGNYTKHWAFQAPSQALLPADIHPIDAFVSTRLERANLQPAPPADAATLCRRLYLDLIGLPPAPADVVEFEQAFQRERSTAAEELIQRLMASPRFGEKWARHWLDVSRYSDSNGYEKDLPREQWAWRDWVIDAFNRDMPYDQFIIEQVAGDLLPQASQEQMVATGFLRNSMINEEGAIVPEEFRMEEMFDRMDCLGKAVLGLSLQCARCHSHKFDPLMQDEYYGMFAFLNNTHEAQSGVYTSEQLNQIQQIEANIRQAEDRLKQAHPAWQQELAAWEAEVRDRQVEWTLVEPTDSGSHSGLNHPAVEPNGSILTLGHPTTSAELYVVATPDLQGITGLRLEALDHQDLPLGGPGRSLRGTWVVSELIVTYQKPAEEDWETVELTSASADFSEPAAVLEEAWKESSDSPEKRVRGPVAFLIDGDNDTGWRSDRGPGIRNQASVAVVQFTTPLDLPAGTKLRIQLNMKHGGSGGTARANNMLGCCRLSLTKTPNPSADPIDHAAILAMQVPEEQRTSKQRQAIFSAWRKSLDDAKDLNEQIASEWKKYPEAPTTVLHLAERGGKLVRPTFLLDRGEWNQPEHVVKQHTPTVLHPLESTGQPNRLDFARWLVDHRSPLTARVAVNRVWQAIFGVGLVETPEDFGTRARLPVYRELLDWLAVDFMENGWSHKHLMRRMLTSATYQQSSHVSEQLLEVDPKNDLLARGPRFRLDAEVVRDSALSVAGLLHNEVGGPSIFPPVPQSVLDGNFVKPDYWEESDEPQRYRRALYVFRKRSMPDPVLCTLDSPVGDFSVARRARSNTPLSALVTLNETMFVESAQALAQRLLREGGPQDADRADYAYQLCTGRSIRPDELKTVLQLLRQQRERLQVGELKATDIAFSDYTDIEQLPPDATPNDIAAWTIVCRVLLNLDEMLSKF